MFKSIRTYLLMEKKLCKSKSIEENNRMIFDTIKQGQCYIANTKRGDASGFRFWMEADGEEVQMGGSIQSESAVLRAELPDVGFCKIIRNGEVCHVEKTSSLKIEVPDGIYRLEVERKGRGWIYTNHIKIEENK
jgi:hypothetical protein